MIKKPEPPDGTEWERIDAKKTCTRQDYETRPYQACPNCDQHKYTLVWSYRAGFITWRQRTRWFCNRCKESETITEESGYIWQS